MADWPYSEDELNRYMNDPNRGDSPVPGGSNSAKKPRTPIGKYWASRTTDPQKYQAAVILSFVVSAITLLVLIVGILFATVVDELPPLTAIENPEFQLATIAYTADGEELARYALQNRSWASYDELSPWLI